MFINLKVNYCCRLKRMFEKHKQIQAHFEEIARRIGDFSKREIRPHPFAERVAGIYGIKVGEVFARGRQQRRVSARSLFCFWAVRELGNSLATLAIRLGMSPVGVGYAVQRGEAIAHKNGYQLIQWDIDLFKGVPPYVAANLAVLCLVHASAADAGLKKGKLGSGKKLKPDEVREFKKIWEKERDIPGTKGGIPDPDFSDLPEPVQDPAYKEVVRRWFIQTYRRAPSKQELYNILNKTIVNGGIHHLTEEDLAILEAEEK